MWGWRCGSTSETDTCAKQPSHIGLPAYVLATFYPELFMYAIFRALGKQFRAEKGKTLRLPLMDAAAGSKVTFDEVLLSSNGETIKTGAPLIKGASVEAEVVGEGKEPKIYVFKFKRRKNYRRKTGHRQRYTEVRITDLKLG
jgi:large subunit ribosomal protein L21